MKKMCPKCGAVYGADEETCARCGAALEELADPGPVRRRQRLDQTAGMKPVSAADAAADAPAPAPKQTPYMPPEEPAYAGGSSGGASVPPTPPKPPRAAAAPEAPRAPRAHVVPETHVQLEPPCRARSVTLFKYLHLICGWVLVFLGIVATIAMFAGAGAVNSGALEQQLASMGIEYQIEATSGELAAALLGLTWIIPVSILIAGLSQLAEGHVLGELLDTNLKLSDENGRRPKPYRSRLLTFMRYVYFIVALGVLALGVYLVVRTGTDGILALLLSVFCSVFYMMRSKRLELFIDNDRKAADIAAQLRG